MASVTPWGFTPGSPGRQSVDLSNCQSGTLPRQPKVTRTAYQRLYDMILWHGTDKPLEYKQKFDDLQSPSSSS